MSRRLEALYAMAEQDVSPEERDIAIAKLETMGAWPPPPKPPTRNAASPAPQPVTNWWVSFTSNGPVVVNITYTSTFRARTTES